MTKLKWAVTTALMILLVAALGVVFGGGCLARAGLEKGATHALGVDARVGGATLSVLGGAMTVSNMRIANPPGFKSEKALDVSKISLNVKLKTLLSEPIVVPRIEVFAPDVTIERSATGTNLGALMDRLEGKGDRPPAPAGSTIQLQVDEVVIKSAIVRLAQSIVGTTETTVALPDITLRNLKTGGQPLTLAELIEKILGAIAKHAAAAGIPAEIGNLLNEEARRAVIESVQGAGENLKKVEDAVKGVEDAASRIGDIFKKKD